MSNGKIKKLIENPWKIVIFANNKGLLHNVSDEKFIKFIYRAKFGKPLDLEHPVLFNEKLQWLKLYNRRLEFSKMVDKAEAKKYVADIIGEEYIIPTIGVWDTFDEVDFKSLPNQFVLKCTHDSWGVAICKDKTQFSPESVRKKFIKCLGKNYYWQSREWQYKNVKPRVIAEQYIAGVETEMEEYKIFTFNGKAKLVLVCKGEAHSRANTRTNDWFDREFNHLDLLTDKPNTTNTILKPDQYEEMISIAEKLSGDIPHLRVDLYLTDGKIYFGELTFFHDSGFVQFKDQKWNRILGEWLELPKQKVIEG